MGGGRGGLEILNALRQLVAEIVEAMQARAVTLKLSISSSFLGSAKEGKSIKIISFYMCVH